WSGHSSADSWAACFDATPSGAIAPDGPGCGIVGVGLGRFELAPKASCEAEKGRELPEDRYVIDGRSADGVSARWRSLAEAMGGGAWSRADSRWLHPDGAEIKVLAGVENNLIIDIFDDAADAIAVERGAFTLT